MVELVEEIAEVPLSWSRQAGSITRKDETEENIAAATAAVALAAFPNTTAGYRREVDDNTFFKIAPVSRGQMPPITNRFRFSFAT
jgi:hypothetical protein